MVMTIDRPAGLPVHTQEPCRLADWYAALHEPTCGRVAKSVRRHLAGQLGESHGAPEPLLDRGHRFAVELNEAGGDQFSLFSAPYVRKAAAAVLAPASDAS